MEIYHKTARWLFKYGSGEPSLRFLSYVQGSGPDGRMSSRDIPSWIPDWRHHWIHVPVIHSAVFKSSCNSTITVSFPGKVTPECDSLFHVRGVVALKIGYIAEREPPIGVPFNSHSQIINSRNGDTYPLKSHTYLEAYPLSLMYWLDTIEPESRDKDGPDTMQSGLFWQFLEQKVDSSDGVQKTIYNTVDLRRMTSEKNQIGMTKRGIVPRRFIMTSAGFMGLAPPGAEVNDEVCILFGAEVPFVIRRQGKYCQLIGECYVYGIMNGEVMVDLPEDKVETFKFI